ncbi:hypothetical protein Zmor_011924 [Zophobas morio]|uniref:Uncharacterized protein n=1 Tax=Zophobas morio TaxID=2755281 RepID=A0AA38LYU0_9CUCU|nr:hypothetical protein Zmor_011924 [Zophobas morio]
MIEVGSIERMFREIQDSMSESDLSTIATDMNLSNDYINYEFKILCRDQNEVRQIVNNTIANKDIVKFTKKDLYDYLVITPKDENGNPIEDDYLSIKVDDNISNFIPTNMT